MPSPVASWLESRPTSSLHRLLADALPCLTNLPKKFKVTQLNFGHMKKSPDTATMTIKTLKDAPGPLYSPTDKFKDTTYVTV